MLPVVKPEHKPYVTAGGNIRIGSVIYGSGAEIVDPPGWLWPLLNAADGTRTPEQIVAAVRDEVPSAPPAEILSALGQLREAGYLEDASATPAGFTEQERERYSRGVSLLRWMDRSPVDTPWRLQERLRDSGVLLIGLGGTGGAAAHALAASGVGRLHCVDPDTVELSNLNRQPYRESDVGRPKAAALARDLRQRNSTVRITAEQRLVSGPEDLAELIGGPDGPFHLLLLCADQPSEIRRWANTACLAVGLPWVDGGYRGPLATAGVHRPGRGACWECQRMGEAERRDLDLPEGADESVASPRMAWSPANAITAGLSGLLVAHAAVALLTGAPRLAPGFRYGLNLMAPDDPVYTAFPRRADCPACGSGDAVTSEGRPA
jgi:molybdopterin/thiamine biosynthesis adenylyltransferase